MYKFPFMENCLQYGTFVLVKRDSFRCLKFTETGKTSTASLIRHPLFSIQVYQQSIPDFPGNNSTWKRTMNNQSPLTIVRVFIPNNCQKVQRRVRDVILVAVLTVSLEFYRWFKFLSALEILSEHEQASDSRTQ